MLLERQKDYHFKELMKWVDTVDNVMTPDSLQPSLIKDYPASIEASERLKRICKWKNEELKSEMTLIEDSEATKIESEEYLFSYNNGGMPVMKKTFNSAEKRARELRLRLSVDEKYTALSTEQMQWAVMFSDWVSHINRLKRELDLLTINYQSNGGEGTGI